MAVEMSDFIVEENKAVALVFTVLRAAVFFAFPFLVLTDIGFFPPAVCIIVSLLCATTVFITPYIPVALFGVAVTASVFHSDPFFAVLFAVLFFASYGFLCKMGGQVFFIVALACLASTVRLEFAFIIIGAYSFKHLGGLSAAIACALIELFGILHGRPSQGLVAIGHAAPLIAAPPKNLADLGWVLLQAKQLISLPAWTAFLKPFMLRPQLFLQPVAWGALMALVGHFVPRRTARSILIGTAAACGALVAAQLAIGGLFPAGIPAAATLGMGMASFLIATAWLGAETRYLGIEFADKVTRSEAIIVIDLVGSTAMGDKYGDSFTFEIKKELQQAVNEVTAEHGVLFRKGTGDGYMLVFPDSRSALSASREILRRMAVRNQSEPPERAIHLRFGGNRGEVQVARDGDRYGTAVNMAFRIEGLKWENVVDPAVSERELPLQDRILVSQHIADDMHGLKDLEAVLVGHCELKGISGRHPVYRMRPKKA